MANDLVKSLVVSRNTYTKCRKYIFELLGKDKAKLEYLENNTSVNLIIPYIIKYIEMKESIRFIDLLNFYAFYYSDLEYSDLVKTSLVNGFKKLEKNDKYFTPF